MDGAKRQKIRSVRMIHYATNKVIEIGRYRDEKNLSINHRRLAKLGPVRDSTSYPYVHLTM